MISEYRGVSDHQILMKSGPIDHKSTFARVMAWRLAISWTYADPVHWYIYAAPGEDWVLKTSANALWHVRHFFLLLCIWSDMCTSFGAHKPCWVFRSFCYTNQCFYCECYLNLYWSVNYHCMWQMRIVICMAINLIWLDLTWLWFWCCYFNGISHVYCRLCWIKQLEECLSFTLHSNIFTNMNMKYKKDKHVM